MKSMNAEHPITISACMMVKNEKEMLPDCLESIKDVVDEIIVVDTGSTDRTVEIAESYGAKIYHHPWENDFSKHRNQSISYATGDWFLIIDADEILVTENLSVPKLKERLKELQSNVHAVLATVWDYNRKGEKKLSWKSSRLFRNHVGVHYEGYVHNQVVAKGKAVDSPLTVNHYGYDLSPEKMEKKFERTDSLLQNRLRENPADYEAYFYLANLYGGHKRYEEALDYGQRMLGCLPEGKTGEIFLKIYYNIGAACANLKRYDEAIDWCHQGLERLPDDIDLHYLLIKIGLLTADVSLIQEHAALFLRYHEEWSQRNMKAGFRFVYHLDEAHKNSTIAHAIAATLGAADDRKVSDLEAQDHSRLKEHPDIAATVVEDLAQMGMERCLLSNLGDLLQHVPDPGTALKPLILRLKDRPEFTGEFLQSALNDIVRSEHYTVFSALTDQFIQSDMVSVARDLLDHGEPLGLPPEVSVPKRAMIAIQQGANDLGLRKIKQGMALNANDKEFYLAAIPVLYQKEENSLLQDALERVLLYFDSFEEVPEYVLLILSHRLVREEALDYLIQATDVLCRRYDISADREIEAWEDLAEIYNEIGQHLLSDGKQYMAQIAWEAGFAMTRNGKYLANIADTYFATGKYDRALSLYADALDHHHQSQEMIKQMKTLFARVNDPAGVEQCNRLLSVYEEAD